jgi:hypothetical protein
VRRTLVGDSDPRRAIRRARNRTCNRFNAAGMQSNFGEFARTHWERKMDLEGLDIGDQ